MNTTESVNPRSEKAEKMNSIKQKKLNQNTKLSEKLKRKSKLVFYAQSTGTVISGRYKSKNVWNLRKSITGKMGGGGGGGGE